MALVIEDGSIVAGANSFASRAEIISYASARGVTLPDDETTDALAIQAMDYIGTLDLRGTAVTDQTPFPRSGLVLGDTEDGWTYTIPFAVTRAQMQLALDAHRGVDLVPSGAPELLVKRKKVGPIEREFFAPGADASGKPALTVAMALLAPYLNSSSGSFTLTVSRA